ncbi:MAG: hypothetical protein J6X55_14580 [Victivallales bacterium]|nr:hypothetical protein [Victivallales bacterium]
MLIALTLLILVGFSWTYNGIVMGGVSKYNVSIPLLQLISYLYALIIGLILLFSGLYPPLSASKDAALQACILYSLVGMLSFPLIVAMAKGMACGPNSLVWAILQSGMVIPFIYGICFHGVKAGAFRLFGMALLLLAVPLMSVNRKSEEKKINGKSWVFFALVAFLICGIQQTFNNEPSYNDEIRLGVPVIHRCLLIYISNLVVATVMLFCPNHATVRKNLLIHLKNRHLWIYAIVLQSITMASGLFLSFNAMDRMAKLDKGAISYPIMVISCIMGFTLYSVIWLRERLTWQAITGLCCCIMGIVFLCIE